MSKDVTLENFPLVGILPKNWEKAFGYDIDQPRRWLAAYWEPTGNEAMMDDGRLSGTAHWPPFIDLINRKANGINLALEKLGVDRWALGSSDTRATHCLLCDLQERMIYVAPLFDASHFMHSQLPPLPEINLLELSQADWDALLQPLNEEWERKSKMAMILCKRCYRGYIPSNPGYQPCSNCNARGSWLIDVEEAQKLDKNALEVEIVWPAA